MKIALDALNLTPARAGVGNYAFHVIHALQTLPSEHQFTVFVNRSVREEFSDTSRMHFVTAGSFSGSRQRIFYQLTRFAGQLQGYDLVHCLDYLSPLAHLSAPLVITVHDVSFLVNRSYFTPAMGLLKRSLLPLSCRRAAGIFTVSEFTKQELLRCLPLREERIFPVLLGTETPRRSTESQPPCVLCVGTLEPRKNWGTAVSAMELLWQRRPDLTLPLVLAGKPGWGYEPLLQQIQNSPYRDRILLPGYCSEEALAAWYKSARAFVFPSFYEGFGLPPIEAMAYGVPVVASAAASLPEVTNGAALLCPPTDAAAFSAAIEEALGSKRETLIAAGKHRAAALSWGKTGQGILDGYQTIAGRTNS